MVSSLQQVYRGILTSRMQPQTIVKSFFTSAKHLINPFTITEELKRRCATNMLSGLRTLIYISIYKRKLRKVLAELLKCRKDLITNSAPANDLSPHIWYYSQVFKQVSWITLIRSGRTWPLTKPNHVLHKLCA